MFAFFLLKQYICPDIINLEQKMTAYILGAVVIIFLSIFVKSIFTWALSAFVAYLTFSIWTDEKNHKVRYALVLAGSLVSLSLLLVPGFASIILGATYIAFYYKDDLRKKFMSKS